LPRKHIKAELDAPYSIFEPGISFRTSDYVSDYEPRTTDYGLRTTNLEPRVGGIKYAISFYGYT